MHDYQRRFLALALQCQALRFGEFTLKSGRKSPYFFNAGQFHTGRALAELGYCYAAAAVTRQIPFDMLFGPAYKGIPLVSAVSIALAEHFGRDVPYCFNRKEAKTHGEGGSLVGAPLAGRVLIVDDVITAGTAIGEVMTLLKQYPQAQASGILIGLDRQERSRMESSVSAAEEASRAYGTPVHSVINLDTLIDYVRTNDQLASHLPDIEQYRLASGC